MTPNPTQDTIEIAGIKDGIIILKDGGYRLILSVSTINFALKSEQEQNALIFQYQSFLNSLHFPIEIVMRSKRLDLTPYLQKISTLAQKQENELLKIQTEDYIDFVGKLINLANIMKKNFYVALPFQPLSMQKLSLADKIFNRKKTIGVLQITEDDFKRYSEELRQRANIVASGLGSMSLHCVQLNTEEIIELYYQIYNPEVAGKERVTDADSLTAGVIMHTSEKKEDEDKQKSNEDALKIDNSQTVQEVQKQQYIQRQQEMENEGQRQIAGAPEASTSKEKPEEKKAETPEAKPGIANDQTAGNGQQSGDNNPNPQEAPAAPVTKGIGNDIKPAGQNANTTNNS